ncbi:hypothetical protein ACGF4C_24125 [Streptomyces sp. NPDC048197]|uniref:hypothetical protein n=1 Tax=Streptomyces sp. NPDC048197 TaxID=3365511 RepID=UPI003721C92F
MTETLVDRLGSLAAQGTPITFPSLALSCEAVADQTRVAAAGPMAPLLAEAIVDAFERRDAQWTTAAAAFPQGLAAQGSFLHLTGVLQTLLGSPTAAGAWAKQLNSALLNDLAAAVHTTPLVAAARLEGAVRLAAAQAVTPYRVWEALDELPLDGPDDFLERMPRLLGVVLDCWSGEETVAATIRDLLQQLSQDEAADADAWFELGCDRLRSALSSGDLNQVTCHLAQARRLFATTAAAVEARQDADAYTAVCDALLGFAAGNTVQVADATDALERALEQQSAWLHGTHQAPWLQPRRAAEAAWSHLLLQLHSASALLDEPVWMDCWQALDCVLGVYRIARTVRPVGQGDKDLTGLASLIEPAIEDGFLRQHSFLAALRHAATHPEQQPARGLDSATAAAVLARLDARTATTSPGASSSSESGEESEEPGGATTRLLRLAPFLTLALGPQKAADIAAHLDDAALAEVEALAYTQDAARLQATDPVIVPLLDEILAQLSTHPHFTGQVRHTFTALVDQTLRFLKSRIDLTRTNLLGSGTKGPDGKTIPPYDYRRKRGPGQREPLESDLQRDFHHWLQSGQLHSIVQVETVDVGMGRADVMVHFGSLRYLTEIKKDATDNTPSYLEGHYLKQAAEYTNTNAPFGQLLVLDLTGKSTGTLRLDELAWTTAHRPTGATIDRAIVVGLVTGNRVTPADYSR